MERALDKRYLVIDIRHCPGGNGAWGYYVLDHLTNSRYKENYFRKDKVSKTYKELIKGYLDKHSESYILNLSERYLKIYKNVLDTEVDEYAVFDQNFIEPKKILKTFNGEIFLLTSHQTFSAGVVFASAFKYSKVGMIVGRETGGRLDFLSDPKVVDLPHSKLRAKMPVAVIVLPGGDPDKGVIPDIEVKYAFEDLVKDVDVDIDAVKAFIRRDLVRKLL